MNLFLKQIFQFFFLENLFFVFYYKTKAEPKWKKLLNQIAFSPKSDDYYTEKPLKPGSGFYKLIAETNLEKNILKAPIPETFVSVDGN